MGRESHMRSQHIDRGTEAGVVKSLLVRAGVVPQSHVHKTVIHGRNDAAVKRRGQVSGLVSEGKARRIPACKKDGVGVRCDLERIDQRYVARVFAL